MELPIQTIVVFIVLIIAAVLVIAISSDMLLRSEKIALDKLDEGFERQLIEINSIDAAGVVDIAQRCIEIKRTAVKEELCVIIKSGSSLTGDVRNEWISQGYADDFLLGDCPHGRRNIVMNYIPPGMIRLSCS